MTRIPSPRAFSSSSRIASSISPSLLRSTSQHSRERRSSRAEHAEIERPVEVADRESAATATSGPDDPLRQRVKVERELLDDEEQRERHDRERHVARPQCDPGDRQRGERDAGADERQCVERVVARADRRSARTRSRACTRRGRRTRPARARCSRCSREKRFQAVARAAYISVSTPMFTIQAACTTNGKAIPSGGEGARHERGRRRSPGSQRRAPAGRTCPAGGRAGTRSGRRRRRRPPRSARSRQRRSPRMTPMHERGDDGAAEAAEAAEHDDRQEPRDQVVVTPGVERIDDAVHRAGGGRHRDAEPEARASARGWSRPRAASRLPGSGRSRARRDRSAFGSATARGAARRIADVTKPKNRTTLTW